MKIGSMLSPLTGRDKNFLKQSLQEERNNEEKATTESGSSLK